MIRSMIPLVAAFGLACGSPPASADPLDPRLHDPALAGLVAFSLQRYHFAGQDIDDALSSAWFDAYIDALDPNKMFFTAQDLQSFERHRHTMDDAVGKVPANLDAAFDIDRVYRERVENRLTWAMKLLEKPVALPDGGTLDLDRSDDPWAASLADLDQLWTLRIQEQMVRAALRREALEASLAEKKEKGEDTSKIKPETEADSREKLRKRYRRILGDLDQQTSADVMEVYLGALGRSFDPHSTWFKPATRDNFDIDMRDSLEGIGATLSVDGEYTVVRDLVPGGPADSGGELQPGDRIINVAQGDEEPVDVVDMRLDDVVHLIRGPKGTEVVLTVWSADSVDPADVHDVRITRDKVVVEKAAAKGEVRELDGMKIGVVDVPSFYAAARGEAEQRSTTADLRRILADFKKAKVDAVVIDLRSNGGGSLSQSIDTTGLFIDSGPVVQVKDRDGRVEVYDDTEAGLAWDGPLVVLTSIFSASASEIFAGAIQDYGRGIVVGSPHTHGKGTVQELISLGQMLGQLSGIDSNAQFGGALKFTTNQFYRVSGRSTQVEGVSADVIIPSLTDDLDIREGDLPGALPYEAISPAAFRPLKTKVDVAALQQASKARVEASEAFQILAELKALRESREDEPLSLDLETRRAERAESEVLEKRWDAAEEDVEGGAVEDAGGDEESEAGDPWLDEALQVTLDYVRAVQGG